MQPKHTEASEKVASQTIETISINTVRCKIDTEEAIGDLLDFFGENNAESIVYQNMQFSFAPDGSIATIHIGSSIMNAVNPGDTLLDAILTEAFVVQGADELALDLIFLPDTEIDALTSTLKQYMYHTRNILEEKECDCRVCTGRKHIAEHTAQSAEEQSQPEVSVKPDFDELAKLVKEFGAMIINVKKSN